MKVERKFLATKPAFEPIKLEITLEAIEDLQWLMAIANVPVAVARNTSGVPMYHTTGVYDKSQMALYYAIESVYKEYTNG